MTAVSGARVTALDGLYGSWLRSMRARNLAPATVQRWMGVNVTACGSHECQRRSAERRPAWIGPGLTGPRDLRPFTCWVNENPMWFLHSLRVFTECR
jgi:hypothetical protein